MHQYASVDIMSLDDQQLKYEKAKINVLLGKEDKEQKHYIITIKDGEIFRLLYIKERF